MTAAEGRLDGCVEDRSRNFSVKVSLSLNLYNQLDEIAKRRGFPVVTFLAVIAGEYVDRVNFELQTQRLVAMETAREFARRRSSMDGPVEEDC